MTGLKSILFFIFVPGLLIGYCPYSISLTDVEIFNLGVFRYVAFLLWAIAGVAGTWCFWNFAINGKGTPAPIDPPKELVVVGLYQYVRNPMYISGVIALLGWMLWSPSLALIVAPFLFFMAAHLFVMFYEEPTLKKKFGTAYDEYRKHVPRWILHFKTS